MHTGIVIPLKSKIISRNWRVTCDSLLATLKSIENQSDRNFSTIIVGHEKPEFLDHEFPDVHFEAVNFAPPNRSSPDFKHQNLVEDKNLKIVTGIQKLNSLHQIDYWYQIDADDLLDQYFIESLRNLDGMGAVLDGGYIFFKNANRVMHTSEMSQYCGSTSILSNKIIHLPDKINTETIKTVPWASIAHKDMERFFEQKHSGNYKVIKDPLICYVLSSGDNISDNWRAGKVAKFLHFLKPYIKGKKITQELMKRYGIKI